MVRVLSAWVFGVVFLLAGAVSPADAHKRQFRGDHGDGRVQKTKARRKAARVRYGGRAGVGYWRPGPDAGYGFGFSSYKGDPFGSDDYYDGGRCYYRKHRDFCVANKIFDGSDIGLRRYGR